MALAKSPFEVKFIQNELHFPRKDLDSISRKIIEGEHFMIKAFIFDEGVTFRRETSIGGYQVAVDANATDEEWRDAAIHYWDSVGDLRIEAFYEYDTPILMQVYADLENIEDRIKQESPISAMMNQIDAKIINALRQGFNKERCLNTLQKYDEENRALLATMDDEGSELLVSYDWAFKALKADLEEKLDVMIKSRYELVMAENRIMEVLYRRILLTPQKSVQLGGDDYKYLEGLHDKLMPAVPQEVALKTIETGKQLLEKALKKAVESVRFDLATQLFRMIIEDSLKELNDAAKQIIAGKPLSSMFEIKKYMDNRREMRH
jgi:hypothetical protein